MSEICYWLHTQLERLPLLRYPFHYECLPLNGIYFIYEDGEYWGHEGQNLRITRVGTHLGNNRLPVRLAEHFDPKKKSWSLNQPKPSDRSVFRKHIGRSILLKQNDPYLSVWNIDFTSTDKRTTYGSRRNIAKEIQIENDISQYLHYHVAIRSLCMSEKSDRLRLEERSICTLTKCALCHPSDNWLGNYLPDIRARGNWNKQPAVLKDDLRDTQDQDILAVQVSNTLDWLKSQSAGCSN